MEYWQERNINTGIELCKKTEAEVEEQLKKYFKRCSRRVIDNFIHTYEKVLSAANNGQSITPADLYKLDSYWKMQAQLHKELQSLGDNTYNLFFKRFTDNYINIYNSLAIPSQENFSKIDKNIAQQMINQIWCADGKSWSQRIWKNTDKLQQLLNDRLLDCVVAGKKTTQLKRDLMEGFNSTYYQANRIARTEIAHIQTQAAQQRYRDYGIREVEVWADKDERRCDECGKHHQERYSVNAVMPVPFHPNCRCCIIPVVDKKDLEI